MILVTGSTGYIGSRLCRHLLRNGYKVCGLIKPSEREKAKSLIDLGLIPYYGDLTDSSNLYEAANNVNLIYHLAGIHSTYGNTYKLYVQGTVNLLRSFSHNPGALMVLASNSSVYASTLKVNHPFGEITMEMEKAVMKFRNKYVIFRIGEVYGDKEANPFHCCTKGITLIGDGMNYSSKLQIEDLINLLAHCVHSAPQGIFDICDDIPVRQIEFYRYVEELSKTKCIYLKPDMELGERILLSIHGLRSINVSMKNHLIKNMFNYKFIFPTYRDGLNYLYQKYMLSEDYG